MKTAALLLLAVSAPVLGDVIVHDNRGPNGFPNDGLPPNSSWCDDNGDSDPFTRLDLTQTPAQNLARTCADDGEGLIRFGIAPPTSSCSRGDWAIYTGRRDAALLPDAIVSMETPVILIPCPDDEDQDFEWPYFLPYEFAAGGMVGAGTLPAGTAWSNSTTLIDLDGYPQTNLDSPEVVGVRFEKNGQTYYGWLQFEVPGTFHPNADLLAWGYESEPGTAVAPIDVASIVRAPDLNADARVDSGDLAILLASWGKDGATVVQSGPNAAYPDIDDDGTVGAGDLAVMLAAWGSP